MQTTGIDFFTMSMPLFEVTKNEKGYLTSGNILGTCFSISQEYMFTANHVLENISKDKQGAIGVIEPNTNRMKAGLIIESEKLLYDLAIFRVEFDDPACKSWFHSLAWLENPCFIFDKICTVGFPFGIHKVKGYERVIQRGFQGHIVSAISKHEQLNLNIEPFPAYELSFSAPRGLSGAPVFTENNNFVIGIVIGNSESKRLISSNEEVSKEGTKERNYESFETVPLGIAVPAVKILDIYSNLLKMHICEFLSKNGKLIRT